MKLWLNSNKRLILKQTKELWACKKCPCDCEPKVFVSQTVNNNDSDDIARCFDLSEYMGDGIGTPGHKWRLIETGACLTYWRGDIDQNGKLVGMQSKFCSGYYYNGYMQLQQGCIQKNGSIKWPGRCS